jgi:hypothetical protein
VTQTGPRGRVQLAVVDATRGGFSVAYLWLLLKPAGRHPRQAQFIKKVAQTHRQSRSRIFPEDLPARTAPTRRSRGAAPNLTGRR